MFGAHQIDGSLMRTCSRRAKNKNSSASDLVIRSSLPAWIVRSLRTGGINRFHTISRMTNEELLEVPGIGKRAVELIREEERKVRKNAENAE